MKNPNAAASIVVAEAEVLSYCKNNYQRNDEYFLRTIMNVRNNSYFEWRYVPRDYANCVTAWMRYAYEYCTLL
jgi:hypothetical protein